MAPPVTKSQMGPAGSDPEVKVTRMKDEWHARLYLDGKVHSEMACECREDIGYICHELLRWFDKLGGESTYASKARSREANKPIGKIRYIRN